MHIFPAFAYYASGRCERRSTECFLVTDATATGFFSSSLFSFLQATTDADATRTTVVAAAIRTTADAAVTE